MKKNKVPALRGKRRSVHHSEAEVRRTEHLDPALFPALGNGGTYLTLLRQWGLAYPMVLRDWLNLALNAFVEGELGVTSP